MVVKGEFWPEYDTPTAEDNEMVKQGYHFLGNFGFSGDSGTRPEALLPSPPPDRLEYENLCRETLAEQFGRLGFGDVLICLRPEDSGRPNYTTFGVFYRSRVPQQQSPEPSVV